MVIRKLELQGFKSFADRATFQFGPGISGVVGPNGCGKSNVVDAVKWCIGEQSAKSLRGDSMADVIFSGSATRPPVNLAEVALTFAATDEPFPGLWARYPEIEVTRRLYRDGHSEYLINQERVRLRDFHDLFLDTGVGNQLYSFIEQGRIGQIVHARPEQRRTLLEEAAGISRYKQRREETLARLDTTRQSLERVMDLADELARQLRSAERAVRSAARHQMLSASIRQAELVVGVIRCAALVGDRRALTEQVKAAKLAFDEAVRAVERNEEELARRRAAAEVVEEELGRLRDELAQREGERRVEESALQYQARETRSAEERLARLDGDQAQARTERDEAQAEAERRAKLREEGDRRLAEARAGADLAAAELRDASRALEEARAKLAATRKAAMVAFEEAARARALLAGMGGRRADLAAREERQKARREEARASDAHLVEELERMQGLLREQDQEVQAARGKVEAAVQALKGREAAREGGLRRVREQEQAARTGEQEVFRREQLVTAAARVVEQVRTRMEALEGLLRQPTGLGDAAKAALSAPGVVGQLAAQLDVPEALEGPLARALEGGLDLVLVPDAGVALRVAAAAKGGVRLYVLPGEAARPAWAEAIGGTPAGMAALGGLLAGSERVGTLAEALERWQRGLRLVTDDGALVREDGVIVLGQAAGAGALALRQRRELATAREEMETRQRAVEEARASVEAARAALPALRQAIERAVEDVKQEEGEVKAASAAVEAARAELRTRELAAAEVRHRLHARQAEKVQAERLAATLLAEEEAIRRAAEGLAAEETRAGESLRQAEARQAAAEDEARRAQGTLEVVEPRAAGAQERMGRLRGEAQALATEVAGHTEAGRAAEQRAARAGTRATLIAQERSDLESRLVVLAEEHARSTQHVQELGEVLGQLRERLEARREEAREAKERTRLAEGTARSARDRRDQTRDQFGDLERRLAEVRASLDHLRAEAEERNGVSLPGLLDRLDRDGQLLLEGWTPVEVPGIQLPEPVPVLRFTTADLDTDVRERVRLLGEWRDQIGKIGEVNPTAAEEYREVAERHADIHRQHQDLQEAMRIIEEAIARINQTCRERFREAFDLVNGHFERVYPRLVGGGSSRLQLTDEDDLLTCGVEIVVQPPGKRIQNLTLLSGGEKAMAALALVFSLFLVKPSPFCLLDEVDAPLDEGNGARFNEMLREMSARAQFIVITHNKKTMEAADVLYGVTMPDPGVSRLVTVRID